MSPAERRRRMNAAQRRGLGQALALDHRPGVIEPFLLLAQMRHRRPGQRIEGAPTALAAKPQKSVRAAPTDDLASRAMRTALSRDALDAGRSQRVLLAAMLALLLRRSSPLGPDRARLLKRRDRLRALPLVHPRNRRQPSRKILSLHRIAPSIRPSLTKSTGIAISAKLFYRPPRRRLRKSRSMRNLDREVRQGWEAGEAAPIIIRLARLGRHHGDNCSEVSRPQPPQVQIGELIALPFDSVA